MSVTKSDSYTFPFYLVETGRPGLKIKDPDKSKAWKDLEAEGRIGNPTVKSMFPLAAHVAKPFLARTREMKEEMVIAVADEEGNIITEDPEIAKRALATAKIMNPHARLHPRSLPLNEAKPRASKSAKS